MGKLYNLARMTTGTTGTGTLTLGSAVTGFLTFATAGVGNGETVDYAIQDGSHTEVGSGVYTSAGTTLTRATIRASTNGGAAIPLSGTAEVAVTPSAETFNKLPNATGSFGVRLVAGTNVTADRTLTLTTGDANRTLNLAAGDVTVAAFGATLVDDADAAEAQATLGVRRVLTATRTYYVRTDGSDSNTGLANTAGGAFLTLQKAYDVVAKTLDTAGWGVTIQLAAGTYTAGLDILVAWVGGGALTILGDTTTPTNVVLSTSAAAVHVQVALPGALTLSGLRFVSSTISSIRHSGAGKMIVDRCSFGAAGGYHMLADAPGAWLASLTNQTIAGGGIAVWRGQSGGKVSQEGGTVTFSGTPAFSGGTAMAADGGEVVLDATTLSGAATGKRYDVASNGVVDTRGGGASFIPGNLSGTTGTGGQYI